MLASNLRDQKKKKNFFKDNVLNISLKDSNKYVAKYFQNSSVNVQLFICSFGCILIRAMVISSSHMHNQAVIFSIFII